MGCGSSAELEPAGFRVVKPVEPGHRQNVPAPKAAAVVAPKPEMPPGKTITLAEVRQHKTASNAWVVVHGQVYDLTKFAKTHPGGAEVITIHAGGDGTADFSSTHPISYLDKLLKYRVGTLGTQPPPEPVPPPAAKPAATAAQPSPPPAQPASALSPPTPEYFTPRTQPKRQSSESDEELGRKPRAPVFLDPENWLTVKLMSKVDAGRNARIFRFALPTPAHILGLPVGKHVQLRLADPVSGGAAVRPYTPVSTNEDRGWFELLVRVYGRGDDPAHPAGGVASQLLDALPVGGQVEVRGPAGSIEYRGRGVVRYNGEPLPAADRLALVAGGTGITPIYQVICRVLARASDETRLNLVYLNRTEEDILLRKELDGLQAARPNFRVWHALTRPPAEGWTGATGRVDANMLEKHLGLGESGKRGGVVALVCGRPGMVEAVRGMLNGLEIPDERILAF